MKYILTYEAFEIKENKKEINPLTELYLTISKIISKNENEYKIYSEFILSEGFYSSLYEESLFQKAKEKAKQLALKAKEKGKNYVKTLSDTSQNLLKLGGDILKPIQKIIQKIQNGITKAWETGKDIAEKAVEKAKEVLISKVKALIKDGDKKKKLTDELSNLSAMGKAGVKLLTKNFTDSLESTADKAAKANESFSYLIETALIKEINRFLNKYPNKLYEVIDSLSSVSILSESGHGHEGGLHIPFLSQLMDKIGHTPPFSYFHDLGHKAEKATNNALEKISYIINKTGGPGPYEFAIIGALVGVCVGYYSELGAKTAVQGIFTALETFLGVTIPGLGILFSVIKYTGIALAIYGTIKAIVGHDEKEKEEEEDNKNNDKQNKH